MKILVVHGPNLNLLGIREPEVYGSTTMEEINQGLLDKANSNDIEIEAFQSNAEHELIDAIQNSFHESIDAIIFNPAGFTHTSVALRDALLAVKIPFFEVHISDIESREDFRKKSYFSDIAQKVFSGHGVKGYELALNEALNLNR